MRISRICRFSSITILLIVLFVTLVSAQQTLIEKLSTYKQVIDKYPIEKIHIHTNQPFYLKTDTIWFKAYVINTNLNRPSTASNILLVDLISPDGKMVRQIKLKLNVGLADGYFVLSDTLRTGNYLLRAYTNGLNNYGSPFYYRKIVNITDNNIEPVKPKLVNNFSINFFPEGGELVYGVKSTVGFKAVGDDGKGAKITGDVVDDNGKRVAKIVVENFGMGRFDIVPEPNRKYFADVTSFNGRFIKEILPIAQQKGYVLGIENKVDSILVNIATNSSTMQSDIVLVASQDGLVRYASKQQLSSLNHQFAIDKSIFYTGVIQFTLFNSDAIPVAERLIFCNHNDKLNIIASNKAVYEKREKVELLVDLKDFDGASEIGSLSISVYNELEYPADDGDEQSIYADLLLMSDLKGYIEKPNSYFLNSDSLNARNLDNLMLTQGWRRFSWKEQLSKKMIQAENKTLITDKIGGNIKFSNGKPYASADIILYQQGYYRDILFTKTDSMGMFSFENLNLIDESRIVIVPVDQKNNNLVINVLGLDKQIQVEDIAQIDKILVLDSVSANENKVINNLFKTFLGTTLKQITITGKRGAEVISGTANLNGSGKADAVVLAKDLETTHNLTTYLVNNITGLKLSKGKIYSRNVPEINVETGTEGALSPPPMLVIFDGMPVDQNDFNISDINPNDVASIEILKGTSAGIYGLNGLGGVIIITQKRGFNSDDNYSLNSKKGLFNFSVTGYQVKREYYSPNHDLQKPLKYDFRKALYWNPSVITAKDKTNKLVFFNSDYSGQIKVVIEGINAEGSVGRHVHYYNVK